ncbi:hypothetical protein QJQ45_021832 [Haematococcus lacustris]|nr:hypothetical protein QJQ45_021832 [Haematococcus lacustris]
MCAGLPMCHIGRLWGAHVAFFLGTSIRHCHDGSLMMQRVLWGVASGMRRELCPVLMRVTCWDGFCAASGFYQTRSASTFNTLDSRSHQEQQPGHALLQTLEAQTKGRKTKASLLRDALPLPASQTVRALLAQPRPDLPMDLERTMINQHRHDNNYKHPMDAPATTFARLLRRSNRSMPFLQSQVVQARVTSITSRHVYLDTGFHSHSEVPLSELDVSHVIRPAVGAPLADRDSLADLRKGDVVRVRIKELFTPYGDMQLEAVHQELSITQNCTWAEISAKASEGRPVFGRVLNQCPGGYAVGVAGFVGLLPYSRTTPATAQRVGELQPFFIESAEDGRRRLVLRDARLPARGAAQQARA